MHTFTRHLALTAFGLVTLCPIHAGFNPAVVSADAKWVVFADLHALRESVLGKELLASMQKKFQPPPAYGIHFDFQRLVSTIGNVTAYGTNFAADATLIDGALVIEGTGALRTIAEGWAVQASITSPKNVSEVTDLPFPAYVLDRQLFVAFPPEPIILIGKSKPQLVKAREVFRGGAISLAQNPSSPLAQLLAQAGRAYGVAASIVPTDHAFHPDAPQARILQLVTSGLATLGEEDQRTIAGAQLVAKSDATAEKLLKIMQGMTAMLSLTETNDRHLAEFLQSAEVGRRGQTVSMSVSYSSERLAQMIEAMHQQQQKPASPATQRERWERSFGRKLVEWTLDKAAPNATPGPQTLAEYTIENVRLTNGATITLAGVRPKIGHGSHAMIDCVEIAPAGGAAPVLRFEAEHMRLRGFSVRNAAFASGGRFIGGMQPLAFAQVEFPGTDGDYVLRVRYFEEASGTTTLAVHLREPVMPPPR